jgi:hypothetical protein
MLRECMRNAHMNEGSSREAEMSAFSEEFGCCRGSGGRGSGCAGIGSEVGVVASEFVF